MATIKDETGNLHGRLYVVGRADKRGRCKRAFWWCQCTCGNFKVILGKNLRRGGTRSCGCLSSNCVREKHPDHIVSRKRSPTYVSWRAMVKRCTNPNEHSFRYYGAKGVKVCDRWRTFGNFLADMGERPKGKTIDRIDPNGNYEPSNCRWATPQEQGANRRKKPQSNVVHVVTN